MTPTQKAELARLAQEGTEEHYIKFRAVSVEAGERILSRIYNMGELEDDAKTVAAAYKALLTENAELEKAAEEWETAYKKTSAEANAKIEALTADKNTETRALESCAKDCLVLGTALKEAEADNVALMDLFCPRHALAPYRICKLCSHGRNDQPGGWPKHDIDCPLHGNRPGASFLAKLAEATAQVAVLATALQDFPSAARDKRILADLLASARALLDELKEAKALVALANQFKANALDRADRAESALTASRLNEIPPGCVALCKDCNAGLDEYPNGCTSNPNYDRPCPLIRAQAKPEAPTSTGVTEAGKESAS